MLILAGEGCYLKVFEAVASNLICQCKIFTDQTVHGIFVQDGRSEDDELQVVIWGGSSLILLRRSLLEKIISQDVDSIEEFEVRTSDWILDVATSPYEKDSCVLITAHNTLLQASLEPQSHMVSLKTLGSPSRSILYSAHLVWSARDCVLVAAGTVFGEIIVWEWSGMELLAECHVITVFTGHEGSIFGVNISPAIPIGPNATTRLLVSCSDDRTIRVWDIYGLAKVPKITDGSEINNAHEINSREQLRSNGKDLISGCIAVVMGHASRIWRVKFHVNTINNTSGSKINIISFGEDATAQYWSLGLRSQNSCHQPIKFEEDQETMELVHLKTSSFHSGKQIWSAAVHQKMEFTAVLATGGADGKISFFDLPSTVCKKCEEEEVGNQSTLDATKSFPLPDSNTWDLEAILAKFPAKPAIVGVEKHEEAQPSAEISNDGKPKKKPKMKKVPIDSFNRTSFVSKHQLLMTTTFGRVFLGDIEATATWQELHLPSKFIHDLKSYSVIKGGDGIALLGGSNGNLFLYRTGKNIQIVGKVHGKVADIFLVNDLESNFIVTNLGAKSATLFKFRFGDIETQSEKTIFGLPEKFIVTSACIADIEHNSILILGSRNGSFAIYDGRSDDSQPDMAIVPLKIWNSDQLQGDAITSIRPLSSSPDNRIRYYITTSRNGLYSIFASAIYSNEAGLRAATFYPVHHGTPPLGPNIEAAWIDNGDLLLSGFRSKNFVVWNESKQYEVTNVECGGAHRSFAYSNLEYGKGYFVYTKATELCIYNHRGPSHQIIKPGGHGREIKSCAISFDRHFIATGAEDTNIRIWVYSNDLVYSQFHCKAVMQKHSAGIQYLQWHGSKYLFSSGGNEEFFIWAIKDIPGFGIGIICEAACPDQSDERDLRIMNFDVTEVVKSSKTVAPELIISLAYSDSTIRTYFYSKINGFALIATGRYTSSCLMQIRHLQVSRQELSLLTAATDGSLVLWNTSIPAHSEDSTQNLKLTKTSTHKIHQSAIKCLDFTIRDTEKSIIVVTGGDDNAIGVTTYSSDNLRMQPRSILLCSAHAAAVTGLCILPTYPQAGVEKLRIVSSSNDQRVKEWEYDVTHTELRKVGDTFTSVADVGDVAVLRDRDALTAGGPKVLVVGNGMEVFTVSC